MSPISLERVIYYFSKFNLLDNGYNIINTLTYSIIGIFIYFLIYPYLIFRKININFRFILSVFNFVVIGAFLRMLSFSFTSLDFFIPSSNNPFSIGFYLYYPNLFLFLGLLFLIFFELSLFIEKKTKFSFENILLFLSYILLFPLLVLFFINLVNYFLFLKLIFFSSIIFIIFYFIFKKRLFLKKSSQLAFFSQVLDSFITFYMVSFIPNNFKEIHVLSNFLISLNPYVFLFVKIFLCLALLFIIDKYVKDSSLNNYFKLFIIIIGFSTALRNLFLISLTFI
ncbi:DUF63 family protein [archaeon]|nr:DUF63 family protein [archaeon]NCP79106.1 DUF63 family protein [archaeon]NCP98573.1 DUF63 family protein [archaeon]NCQ06873.1 DUF63 family protein [archaeon]NCQ50669.1 DUF63 family protein [archaeon]